ncbi:MAG: type 4a pilus biogenesis protein PilO [Nitrospirota bacterium]
MADKVQKNDIEFRAPSKAGTFIGVLLVLVAVVGYFFYTKSLAADVSAMETDITSKEVEIESIKSKISEFETAEEELGIATEVQKIESLRAIPSTMKQDEVIKDIIQITDTYDIELKSLSFGEGNSAYDGVDALRINASFEGNYTDLVTFLEGVEQNPRIFKVESINVQLNELDVLNIKRATFSLAMEAYFSEVQ